MSVHRGGGCLPQCMLGCHNPPGWRAPPDEADQPPQNGEPPRTRQTPPGMENPPDQADPPGMENPPRSRLQHTVYERPVCILLECIIVFYHFPNISCLKCTVNSNFHLIQGKTLLTNDFELTVPSLYSHLMTKYFVIIEHLSS